MSALPERGCTRWRGCKDSASSLCRGVGMVGSLECRDHSLLAPSGGGRELHCLLCMAPQSKLAAVGSAQCSTCAHPESLGASRRSPCCSSALVPMKGCALMGLWAPRPASLLPCGNSSWKGSAGEWGLESRCWQGCFLAPCCNRVINWTISLWVQEKTCPGPAFVMWPFPGSTRNLAQGEKAPAAPSTAF